MKEMVKIALVVFFTLVGIILYGQEEPVSITTPRGEVKGTLLMPVQVKLPVKVVLLHAGSGPTDRNGNQPNMTGNSLKMLAEALASNGIASVRFDKLGIGESASNKFKEIDVQIETYVDDVKQWIDKLTGDKRFSGVITAGHSEGALITLIATVGNPRVEAYVSMAGIGRPAYEVLKEQLSTLPELTKQTIFPMIDTLKQGDTLSHVPPLLYNLFRPSVQPYLISWFKYNPQTLIKELRCPVLILQGDKDIQVSVTDADLLAVANPKAKEVVIPNMNHVLKDCDTLDKMQQMALYTNPDLPLNRQFITVLTDFVKLLK